MNSKTRAPGYDDPYSFNDADKKGKHMICVFCYGSNQEDNRLFMRCDDCDRPWHLDCISPPPTFKKQWNNSRPYWRCPLHVEGDIRKIGNNGKADLSGRVRLHKLRQLANPRVMYPYKSSFPTNNGIIDVELDPEPEELAEDQVLPSDGVQYKLSEQTIKLNFIEKVKQ
jgi:hypothetical protein